MDNNEEDDVLNHADHNIISGAMVIFKFTKPKVVNYEVIHYPQHHVEHHVDHHAPAWDAHGPYQARSYEDAHEMAYSGQIYE